MSFSKRNILRSSKCKSSVSTTRIRGGPSLNTFNVHVFEIVPCRWLFRCHRDYSMWGPIHWILGNHLLYVGQYTE